MEIACNAFRDALRTALIVTPRFEKDIEREGAFEDVRPCGQGITPEGPDGNS